MALITACHFLVLSADDKICLLATARFEAEDGDEGVGISLISLLGFVDGKEIFRTLSSIGGNASLTDIAEESKVHFGDKLTGRMIDSGTLEAEVSISSFNAKLVSGTFTFSLANAPNGLLRIIPTQL